ncbi:MAG: hypothetical protein R2874_02910 [Desulfobacterales bacterium]
MDRMRRAAGPNFLFAAKLTRTLTHEIDPGGVAGSGAPVSGRYCALDATATPPC